MRVALMIGLISFAGIARAADGPTLSTDPSPITLTKEIGSVTIEVAGVAGQGPVKVDVNIGAIERVETDGDRVRLRYRPPRKRFPQMICLALWREKGKEAQTHHVFRVPMLGRTVVPVRTRRNSEIVINVGGRLFGPHRTNRRGKRRVRVLVEPGITEAMVKVTDRVGLETHKKIRIRSHAYNQLAMAVTPMRTDAPDVKLKITLGVAVSLSRGVKLKIAGQPVQMNRVEPGIWSVVWAPDPRPEPGPVTIAARLAGRTVARRRVEVEILPAAAEVAPPPVVVAPPPRIETPVKEPEPEPEPEPTEEKMLRGVVGLGVGMLHNTGAVLSPRFGLEAGLEYRLPHGWIGVRAFAAVSWASQRIEAELGEADSSVIMVPMGGGISYRYPLPHVTPYLLAGCMAQLIHSTSSAAFVEESRQRHWALALLGQVGAERGLGPGLIFLQAGYLHSRLDSSDVELLAGGILIEAGYRFRL